MNSILSLIFDIAIFAALAVVIYYCIRLSRQFTQMSEDKKAFDNLFKSMNVASSRAESAIKSMKEVVSIESSVLQDKINKGKGLTEELEIIIQAGDSLANRLEELSSKHSKTSHGRKHDDEDENNFKTQAEKNLMEAVRAKHK